MTIRVLLATDAVGGVWVYSVELARALQPLGVEVHLAVMGPPPGEAQRREASGIPLIDTGLPLDWMDTSPDEQAQAGLSLAAIATREKVDIVQTCSAAILARAGFAQPTVAVQHSCVASWWAAVRGTPLPEEFAWRRDLTGEGLRNADAVVAPTAAFADETRRLYDLPQPVGAVHNGRSVAPQHSAEQGRFILTASRLWDEGKNVATLDAAAAQIEAPFHAAGSIRGPNGASIRIDHLLLQGQLDSDRLAELRGARPIFASAALYEPFGLSVLEAAQAGCPLVLSDIATHRELWGEAAVYVPARDADAFAAAINGLLAEPQRGETLGRAAQQRAALYTPEQTAETMKALYEQLATGTEATRLQLAGAAA